MDSKPTLLMIPCFAGAPWQLDQSARLREIRWSAEKTCRFFVQESPPRAYVNWVHAVGHSDCTPRLSRISLPTVIVTPDGDRLIGKDAAGILSGGIRRSREVVLPRTGHMFRFSHPSRYSEVVHTLLQSTIPAIGGAQ